MPVFGERLRPSTPVKDWQVAADPVRTPAPWVRPSDWLVMPTIVASDKMFAGLYAVFDQEANYVAISASGSADPSVAFAESAAVTARSTARPTVRFPFEGVRIFWRCRRIGRTL